MERIQFPVRSFADSLWNWHLASMWCQADNITESKGYSCLVTNNCICDDNDVVDRVENGDCNHHYYNKLKMLLGPQINGKETEIGTWNWMSDWNVHKKPKMCGNVEVAAISLDHEAWLKEGGFWQKSCCPEFLRKTRCWQTDCSGIQGWLIRYWKFLLVSEDLSGPDCTLKPLECAPFHGLRHPL